MRLPVPSTPCPAQGVVVALDGGNSKTDIVVVTTDGEVLSRGRSGPFLPHLQGAQEAVGSFVPAVERAMASAGVARATHVAAYLANADLPVETAAIRAAVLEHDWADSVTVENDTFAVLRAGTERGFGVAVVCGAGINAVGVAPGGAQVRFPALGRITGDWGGGLGLAEETLWSSVRAEDGRGPATTMTTLISTHFATPDATTVAEQLHLGILPPARMHELVTVLFDAGEAGDPVAVSIIERQAEEIVTLVATTVRRLGLLDSDVDVVLGGGILAAREAVLLRPLGIRLAAALPTVRPVFLCSPPVLGAAMLGLEQLWADGADPPATALRTRAVERLRSALEPRSPQLAGAQQREDPR